MSILCVGMFAAPFFLTFSFVNSIAWYYGSSSALPWGTIVLVILSWGLVTFPLTIFGTSRAWRGVAWRGAEWRGMERQLEHEAVRGSMLVHIPSVVRVLVLLLMCS